MQPVPASLERLISNYHFLHRLRQNIYLEISIQQRYIYVWSRKRYGNIQSQCSRTLVVKINSILPFSVLPLGMVLRSEEHKLFIAGDNIFK
jgi:hypothetical protein